MDDRFNNLDESLHFMQATLTDHEDQISTLEAASCGHDAKLTQLRQLCLQLEESHKLLQNKFINLKAHSQHQNIKVVGLPEKAEDNNPVEFFVYFLCDLLGPAHVPTPIEVDRAHRLGQPPDPRARPHVMIARIHSFRVKEKILRLAQENTPLTYVGKQILVFPDFPAETMKQRQTFEEVRKKLKDARMHTRILHPVRLRVTKGADIHKIFNTP